MRKSASFPTKAAAMAWAGRIEAEILAGFRGDIPAHLTVRDLLDRYEKEVSVHKKGWKWEKVRLEGFRGSRIASVRLRELDSPHAAAWQQERLKAVSGASVRRERNLLSAVFNIARKEWKLLRVNPFDGVRRTKDGKARDRLATQAELDAVLKVAAVSPDLVRAITLAVETGMRASEIAHLRDWEGRVAKLVDSKNGEARKVPLSTRAVEALVAGPIMLTAGTISALWARYAKEAEVKDLHFHDLRHLAITRLAERLEPMELARMVGHKDLRMTMRYYRKTAESIAEKLG